ncbi:ATPase central region domain-containing protein [uncultured Mediterranean phage uvMED]|nr:ATPase central region domain-containing protein [uncultured Mediterranean phage uvMED]
MRRLKGFNDVLGEIAVGIRKQQNIKSKVNSGIELNEKEKAQYRLILKSEEERKENLKKINESLKHKKSEKIIITPRMLFDAFKREFEKDGKKLILNDHFKANLKTVMYYFLNNDKFYQQDNLSKRTSPDLSKGLLIVGHWGNGKSTIMEVFHRVFKGIKGSAYRFSNTNDIVSGFESCENASQKHDFLKPVESFPYCFDDVLTERVASNYGKNDLIKTIIETRCNKKIKTHITCNYPKNDHTIEGLQKKIRERYGDRVNDRIYEMFNIIEFKGKSFRN